MRKIWLIIAIAMALLFAWARTLHGEEGARVQGDPSSLKLMDNLTYAAEMARGWETDAILVAADADEVKEDGTVNITDPTVPQGRIVYRFFSPRNFTLTSDPASAHRQVVLERGAIRLEEDDRTMDMAPLPSDFKDMDEAWRAAKAKGAHGRAQIRLQREPATPDHPFCYRFLAGAVALKIDALSGEVVE